MIAQILSIILKKLGPLCMGKDVEKSVPSLLKPVYICTWTMHGDESQGRMYGTFVHCSAFAKAANRTYINILNANPLWCTDNSGVKNIDTYWYFQNIDPFFDTFKISIRIEKFCVKVGNTLYKFLDILERNFATFLHQFLEKLVQNCPKNRKLFWEKFEIICRK